MSNISSGLTDDILLVRSMLYVPANVKKMVNRAIESDADCLVFDLEDSVPSESKAEARTLLSSYVKDVSSSFDGLIIVRINSSSSGHQVADIEQIPIDSIDGLLIPKIFGPEDLQFLSTLPPRMVCMLLIETPLALMNLNTICASLASFKLRANALVLGGLDFTREMRISPSDSERELDYPRAVLAVAARAYNMIPIDGVHYDYRDSLGLETSARSAKQIGFGGKSAIHPAQIPIINSVFSPNPEELEDARNILNELEKAKSEGRGSASYKGKMIDLASAGNATYTLRLAQHIDSKNKSRNS